MKYKYTVFLLLFILTINSVSAATITVDLNSPVGSGNFSSIQKAINFAQENDAIAICKGNYTETVTIDKQLNIYSESEDPDDVIINPEVLSDAIIHITSDNVGITGLTVLGSNSGGQIPGILLDNTNGGVRIQNNIVSGVQDGLVLNASSGNLIKNNTLLSTTLHGIYLVNSTTNYLRNNRIIGNKYGIYLDLSGENTVCCNNVTGNEKYGVALRKADNNNVTDNRFSGNKYGLCLIDSGKNTISGNSAGNNKEHGFLLWVSRSNTIRNNILAENENVGIYIRSLCSENTLEGNILSDNDNGISIGNADNNLVINNTFSSNEEYGIFYFEGYGVFNLFPYNDNTFKDNRFLNNKKGKNNLTAIYAPAFTILFLAIAGGFAYFLTKSSFFKKALKGLVILIAISFIIIVAWYFPFESTNPKNNVEITNLSWNNISVLNQTHTQGTLSVDIDYRNKQAYTNNFADNPQTNIIPVRLRIFSDEYNGSREGLPVLIHEEAMNLTYRQPLRYEMTLELEDKLKHEVEATILFREEYDYPHPYYGESKWELLGTATTDIDLRDDAARPE